MKTQGRWDESIKDDHSPYKNGSKRRKRDKLLQWYRLWLRMPYVWSTPLLKIPAGPHAPSAEKSHFSISHTSRSATAGRQAKIVEQHVSACPCASWTNLPSWAGRLCRNESEQTRMELRKLLKNPDRSVKTKQETQHLYQLTWNGLYGWVNKACSK